MKDVTLAATAFVILLGLVFLFFVAIVFLVYGGGILITLGAMLGMTAGAGIFGLVAIFGAAVVIISIWYVIYAYLRDNLFPCKKKMKRGGYTLKRIKESRPSKKRKTL